MHMDVDMYAYVCVKAIMKKHILNMWKERQHVVAFRIWCLKKQDTLVPVQTEKDGLGHEHEQHVQNTNEEI